MPEAGAVTVRVYLASAGPPDRPSNRAAFERLARGSQRHELVRHPGDADVVLFTECHFTGRDWRLDEIRRAEVARRYWDRCYVYDERDRPWAALPGLFVSMPASSFDGGWQVATSYTVVEEPWRKVGDDGLVAIEADLLFSFVGSRTHRCRDSVFGLVTHPNCVVEPVTDGFAFYDPSSPNFDEHQRRFTEVLYRSKFVLCPRGTGTSSIRAYEVMAAGRVPVVISDAWVPPVGPEWDSFAVRWPESEVDQLPEHLGRLEPQAAEMGRRARSSYLAHYAPEVWFDRRMDELEDLHRRRQRRDFPRSGLRTRAYVGAGAFTLLGGMRAATGRLARKARAGGRRSSTP